MTMRPSPLLRSKVTLLATVPHYYDLLAKATQQHIAPENNTYEAFRPAQPLILSW